MPPAHIKEAANIQTKKDLKNPKQDQYKAKTNNSA